MCRKPLGSGGNCERVREACYIFDGRLAYPCDYLFPAFITFGPLLIDVCQEPDLEHRFRVLGNIFGRRWTLGFQWGWPFWLLRWLLFLGFRGLRSFGKILCLHDCDKGLVRRTGFEQPAREPFSQLREPHRWRNAGGPSRHRT